MNLLNLLTKEKLVAGIEISDSVVRIAFFRPSKKVKTLKDTPSLPAIAIKDELILLEEPIESNIIADGLVLDVELLGKALRNIWEKADLGTDYAVVAIPDDKIYSRVFSFPKSVDGARLTEAMRLAISFQIPMKTEETYLDWERVSGSTGVNEILFSIISRDVAKGYVEALEKAGIKTLALESHIAAIARSVKLTSGVTTLFSKKTPDGATIFAIKDSVLRFSRTLPLRFVADNDIETETKKVTASLSSEMKGEVVGQDFLNANLLDEYAEYKEASSAKSKWLVAMGAAIRAKIPEGQDNLVSLLPVGTEEAYAYQKATTFVVLMRNLTVGVSVFFVVAYLAAYIFIFSLARNTTDRITTLSATAMPPELADMESKVAEVNVATEAGAAFLAEMPMWSSVLSGVSALTTDGITISRFYAPNLTEKLSVTGVAKSRAVLNEYKKVLQDSPLLTEVEIPLTNLEQEGAVPFTASFLLKDIGAVYYTSNQAQQ